MKRTLFAGATAAIAAVAVISYTALDQVAHAGAHSQGNATIKMLADACASSVGADGFGGVTISGKTIISNEAGEITVPCRLRFAPGASLTLNNVRLSSRHLSIRDVEQSGATTVRVENSQLLGAADSGFLLDLYDSQDWFALHNSTISYDRSVWVRVSGNRATELGGGRIDVTNSTIRSFGQTSEGIQLVAGESNGGRAQLLALTLESPAEKIVFAEDCKAIRLVGAPSECGPLGP